MIRSKPSQFAIFARKGLPTIVTQHPLYWQIILFKILGIIQ
jgi:hypothetical protein